MNTHPLVPFTAARRRSPLTRPASSFRSPQPAPACSARRAPAARPAHDGRPRRRSAARQLDLALLVADARCRALRAALAASDRAARPQPHAAAARASAALFAAAPVPTPASLPCTPTSATPAPLPSGTASPPQASLRQRPTAAPGPSPAAPGDACLRLQFPERLAGRRAQLPQLGRRVHHHPGTARHRHGQPRQPPAHQRRRGRGPAQQRCSSKRATSRCAAGAS